MSLTLPVATSLQENFRFMVVEVIKQVEATRRLVACADPDLMEKIESRDDYIDNQKTIIENACFSRIHGATATDKRTVDMMRAINIITGNLERIADFCVNIVGQFHYLSDHTFLARYDYEAFFEEVIQALQLIGDALFAKDVSQAFKICRAEFNLDGLYKAVFDRILLELRSGAEIENLITSHLIFRYLERMGDSLLNIGEAIIFAAVGEKFKIHQYEALKDTLTASGADIPISDVEFQSIWGTRSGCRIGRVQDSRQGKRSHGAIFKEGNRKKLLQEKESIERWESVMPGLPPKIHAFTVEDTHASMLVEYLSGCTLQDVVLNSSRDILENATFMVEATLSSIWETTRQEIPVTAGYMAQATSRLEDVYRLHPGFELPARKIGRVAIPSPRELLERASAIEKSVAAPFSVFIHGDFNINNIVYCHEEQRVHFIDLHRSKDSDYLQDISVFLVSNFRLPVMERGLRANIDWITGEMLRFVREFGATHTDPLMEIRLTLGLARSFITSARFELDSTFAKAMFQRGVYLLDKIASHGDKPLGTFRLPDEVLVY